MSQVVISPADLAVAAKHRPRPLDDPPIGVRSRPMHRRIGNAGTPPDDLRELMGHKALSTTRTYYRVTEHRIRGAVDKIVQFQFDRHGAPDLEGREGAARP